MMPKFIIPYFSVSFSSFLHPENLKMFKIKISLNFFFGYNLCFFICVLHVIFEIN